MLSKSFPSTTPYKTAWARLKLGPNTGSGRLKRIRKGLQGVENERVKAKEEAQIARLAAFGEGDAKAQVEDYLARVQATLVIDNKATHKIEAEAEAKAEAALLEVEQTSLMLKIKAAKDEVSSLQS